MVEFYWGLGFRGLDIGMLFVGCPTLNIDATHRVELGLLSHKLLHGLYT